MFPPAITVPFAQPAVSGIVVGGTSVLFGWSFLNTDPGNPATVALFDGSSDQGAIVVPISLAPGESTRDWLAEPGILVRTSLHLEIVAGHVVGSVWSIPGDRVDAYLIGQGIKAIWGGES